MTARQLSMNLMIRLLLLLFAFRICPCRADETTSIRLRGKRQHQEPQHGANTIDYYNTFRITVLNNLIQRESGTFTSLKETVAIPMDVISNDGVETSQMYAIELPENIQSTYQDLIETGTLVITISDAYINENDNYVHIDDDATVTVLEKHLMSTRKLSSTGTRSLAVLRVSLSLGAEVSYSVDQIQQHIFNDNDDDTNVSLTSQFKRCSNGKLTIENAGVYQVTVPGSESDFSSPAAIRNEALALLAMQQNVASADQLADHVMVTLPPTAFPGFVGNAGVNHWVSTLNDLWSLDVMVYMHEFAHNLGLGHALLSDNSWDYSSYMSPTGFAPNLQGPLKCFNAASNREMGWFDDRTKEVNVYANPPGMSQIISLAAFSEASKSDDPILIQIGEYSLQYNYASEFNIGTEMLQNQVTIARSETGKTIVEKNGLEPLSNPFFSIEDFDGSGKTLQIEACEKIAGDAHSPNKMIVGIALGLSSSASPCGMPTAPATTATSTTTPTAMSTTATTTSATTTTSTTTTTTTTLCPDTAEERVAFSWGLGTLTTLCRWIDQSSSRRQVVCEMPNIMANNQKSIVQTVSNVCQRECQMERCAGQD